MLQDPVNQLEKAF